MLRFYKNANKILYFSNFFFCRTFNCVVCEFIRSFKHALRKRSMFNEVKILVYVGLFLQMLAGIKREKFKMTQLYATKQNVLNNEQQT